MAKAKQMYTPTGYQELVDELKRRKEVDRETIKVDIATARSFGDLSENSEYDAALNEQATNEARIKELEELIENAVVIDESELDAGVVNLGSIVKIHDEDFDEDVTYNIVGSNEADPLVGKVSNVSPIGKALIGHKAGDEVKVNAPQGEIGLKILSVERKN